MTCAGRKHAWKEHYIGLRLRVTTYTQQSTLPPWGSFPLSPSPSPSPAQRAKSDVAPFHHHRITDCHDPAEKSVLLPCHQFISSGPAGGAWRLLNQLGAHGRFSLHLACHLPQHLTRPLRHSTPRTRTRRFGVPHHIQTGLGFGLTAWVGGEGSRPIGRRDSARSGDSGG